MAGGSCRGCRARLWESAGLISRSAGVGAAEWGGMAAAAAAPSRRRGPVRFALPPSQWLSPSPRVLGPPAPGPAMGLGNFPRALAPAGPRPCPRVGRRQGPHGGGRAPAPLGFVSSGSAPPGQPRWRRAEVGARRACAALCLPGLGLSGALLPRRDGPGEGRAG